MKKKPAAKKRVRRPAETKSEATRRILMERALAMFQDRGVEATTMRDIARASNLSLGAAYYYFPSKEALIFAYYEQNQQAMEELGLRASGTLRERLGALMHGKLESIRPQRAMLGAIVARLVDPGDPVGAFSAQTRAVRERAIQIFAETLAAGGLTPPAISVAAHTLWLLQMATLLVFVNDTSAKSARTHGLVDDGLDLLVPLLPLLATPPGRAICERVTTALGRAGIALAPQSS
ncbi:MAG: TetR family transcriptional regulator [Myxococcota bacterium]|nr:TetR family transcriptional regulator [Deltaproteobacteria bacterium]MDQ3339171.1 TetR family transcriptional regulator [Myxococcota bacterium]